ncbi:MAG TPA: hypothetical protein P5277_01705 [Candidatus Paceibacterota bacterium]|nr:hypothetical protein [Candidatus Paceibacterota bacterium]
MEEECCPKFDPKKWDEKTFHWKEKKFIRDSMTTLFHIPLSSVLTKKITRICSVAEKEKKVSAKKDEVLLLFRDPSAFKSEIYLSVIDEIPGEENVKISGTFIAKVYSGPYKAVPKFIKEFNEYLANNGKKAKDYYIHYAYCPKCAKKYGDNYMIIFAEI